MYKHFNPDLQGYSTDESFPGEPEAGLNVAVGGAIALYVFTILNLNTILVFSHYIYM